MTFGASFRTRLTADIGLMSIIMEIPRHYEQTSPSQFSAHFKEASFKAFEIG